MHKCSPHLTKTTTLMSQGKCLSLSAPSLIQVKSNLPPVSSRAGTWQELRQPLQQAGSLSSYHCHTHRAPHLTHHLAKQTIRIPLPSSSPPHSCTSLLCKEPKEEVQVAGQVTPGSSNKLALLQPPHSSQPCT